MWQCKPLIQHIDGKDKRIVLLKTVWATLKDSDSKYICGKGLGVDQILYFKQVSSPFRHHLSTLFKEISLTQSTQWFAHTCRHTPVWWGGLNENVIYGRWWSCFGRSRKCGLTGGSTSLGTGFEVVKPYAIPSSLSDLCLQFEKWAFSSELQLPCMPPLWTLTFWNLSPNKPFLL